MNSTLKIFGALILFFFLAFIFLTLSYNVHAQTIELSDDDQAQVEFIKSIDDRILYSEEITKPIIDEKTLKRTGSQDVVNYTYLGNEVDKNITFFKDGDNYSNVEVVNSNTIKEYFKPRYFKNNNGQVQEVFTERTSPTIWNTTKIPTTAEKILSLWNVPVCLADSATSSLNDETMIDSSTPTTNNSTQDVVACHSYGGAGGSNHALFNFTLPSGSGTITDVKLYLYKVGGGTTALQYDLHKIKRTDLSIAQTTWNIYKTGSNWDTAGATGANDYDSTIIDTGNASQSLNSWTNYVLMGTGADNSLTLAWEDTVSVMIKPNSYPGDSNYTQWASSEATDSSKHPYLEITFTAEEEETATTTIDLFPCEIPDNDDIAIITGCKNIYNGTTSSSTITGVEYFYYDIPAILYIFIFSVLTISLYIISLTYSIMRKKK